MNEFSLINQFFKPLDFKRDEVLLGIGDDAACVAVPHTMNLLISTDTLVDKVHFLYRWNAYDIACRCVRVNVSDLAAMAALPCWATIAITLPEIDVQWLDAFSRGLKDSLQQFNMSLIGGDTTKGPLSITLTVFGQAPYGQEVRRSGAKPGDIIFVSGVLGAAALAVNLLETPGLSVQDHKELKQKLIHPQPRVDLINYLRTYATAAIDISDGLSADLHHICIASGGLGATLNQKDLPFHPLLNQYCPDKAVDLVLTGGDDYELCFTVPSRQVNLLLNSLKHNGLTCYPIGIIEEQPGLRIKTVDNRCLALIPQGYSHF